VGIVVDVTDGVAIGNGPGVQRSIVAAGTPTVVLLRYDIECRGPGTLGAASCAIPQHGVELGFGDFEPVKGEATWSAVDRRARCSPNVVDSVVANVSLNPSGTSKVRKLGKKSVDRSTSTDDFHTRNPRVGGLSWGSERCGFVQEAVTFAVHHEAEVGEEIGSDEGSSDVSYNEAPREIPA
jgi:hypothetical protein